MDKKLVIEFQLKIAQIVLFDRLADEKNIGLFEAIELSSGEFLSKVTMQDGEFSVYGGGGLTNSKHNKWNIDFQTIGIGRVGARCGCVFKIQPKSWVTDNALYISKIKGDFDIDFMLHYLSYCNLNQYANTAAQPVISQKRISVVRIPQIDIKTQKSLVEVLSAIEAGVHLSEDEFGIRKFISRIEKNSLLLSELTHQRALLTRLRQSILQDAVQGRLTAQWRQAHPNQEPASELLRRIREAKAASGKKEKTLPPVMEQEKPFELPEGWVWCRLGEVGLSQTGTTPKTEDKDNFGDFIPFVKPADITLIGINYKNEGLSKKGLKQGVFIPKNSLLMVCIGGSIGKSHYTNIGVSCNQQINSITPLAEVTAIFLQILLQAPYFQKAIWGKASGGTTPIVNRSKWESIPIPLPPLPEQTAIVARVDAMLERVSALEAESARQRAWAEGLLQAALREAMGG